MKMQRSLEGKKGYKEVLRGRDENGVYYDTIRNKPGNSIEQQGRRRNRLVSFSARPVQSVATLGGCRFLNSLGDGSLSTR
jgi:hypothetical protein